jgi:septal ring factor EnvC (AmiA/AmiB activator)
MTEQPDLMSVDEIIHRRDRTISELQKTNRTFHHQINKLTKERDTAELAVRDLRLQLDRARRTIAELQSRGGR